MINLGKDFYGTNFVWWTGVIEDVYDELAVGNVKVRIFGIHSQDKTLLPTKDLPWAQVLLPANGVKTYASPKIGDWAVGFFQDGGSAQIPVVFGILNGIWRDYQLPEKHDNENKYSEITVAQNPNEVYNRKDGEPLNPPTSRNQVEGTMVDKTNNDLAKVCDIVPQFLTVTGYIKFDFSVVMQKIRQVVRALVKALGGDPTGLVASAVSWLKKLNKFIQNVTDIVKEIQDYKQIVVEVAARIRAILDYILSLPAKLLKFLQDCLQYFLGGVNSFLQNAINVSVDVVGAELGDLGGEFGDFTSLVSEVSTTVESVKTLGNSVADVATLPLQAVETFLNPASQEDITAVQSQVDTFIYSFTDPKYVEGNSFNLANMH
jgi:hypothetical protein